MTYLILGGGEEEMAKFVLYPSGQEWRWRLVAANGQKICWGEAYSSKQAAKDSIVFVKANASGAAIEE